MDRLASTRSLSLRDRHAGQLAARSRYCPRPCARETACPSGTRSRRRRRPPGDNGRTVDQDLAAGRRDQCRHHVEDGALAAARGAEQSDELAAPDIEGDVDAPPRWPCPPAGRSCTSRARRCAACRAAHRRAACVRPGSSSRIGLAAALRKLVVTTSSIVSGLMPVISRNQTFSPRAKLAASMRPS